MYPIPKHLAKILTPIGDDNTEFECTGKLKCTCNSEDFEIKIVADSSSYKKDQVLKVIKIDDGYFLIIKASCKTCNTEHLLFDNDFHGWNGFVCGGDNRELERPIAQPFKCDACDHTEHKLTLQLESQGKEDFMEEGGDEFGEDNWVEGFSWFTIKTECTSCKKVNPEWISYETM